jgi:hypothetical protein
VNPSNGTLEIEGELGTSKIAFTPDQYTPRHDK